MAAGLQLRYAEILFFHGLLVCHPEILGDRVRPTLFGFQEASTRHNSFFSRLASSSSSIILLHCFLSSVLTLFHNLLRPELRPLFNPSLFSSSHLCATSSAQKLVHYQPFSRCCCESIWRFYHILVVVFPPARP